ncbi:MAG TPA: VOC family protein [Acidimicrobiales bacterium]|nr:VOC family protein [Acidimicrobiales bacterium]
MTKEPVATLTMFDVDCSDPARLAQFYSAVLGWEVTYSEGDYSMIGNGSTSIGFGKVEGYTPPSWPDADGLKRYHLDLQVDDIAKAANECEALGARTAGFQPGGDRWRVMLDPNGHPFCLCRKAAG